MVPQLGVGLCVLLPAYLPCRDFVWLELGLVHAVTATVSNGPFMSGKHSFTTDTHFLWLLQFFYLLFHGDP